MQMNATAGLAHGFVQSPDGRGTIDILWSCLLTVFLCSWSVLFLNIPRKRGRGYVLRTKLKWVAFTIFLPEVLAAFAQQQWISASQSVSDFKQINGSKWSLRHAFFADMGGIILESPDYVPFPIDAHQLHYLITNNFVERTTIDKEDIWDKNKADGFARLLTSVQVFWFALQCLGRAVQHLPISTFELSTLAFVFCTLPTFFWWRHKPLDVITTISVCLKPQVRIEDVLRDAGDRASRPFKHSPLDFLKPRPNRFDFVGPVTWGIDVLFGVGGPPKHAPITSFQNSARLPPRETGLLDWVVIGTISIIYMGLHLVGWNFTFPTAIERQLWRAATVILLGAFLSYGILFIIIAWRFPAFCRLFGVSGAQTVLELLSRLPRWFQYSIAVSWIGSYGLARLYILAEAFIGLRALPLAAYNTVDWTQFLPHI
jgi:hypothetical protein